MDAFGVAALKHAKALDTTLRTWAFETERRAKKKSPVDTGFNSNSIYTVTPDGKMGSNGQAVNQRPGAAGASTKGKKKYKAGQFAEQAEISPSAGYQDLLGGGGVTSLVGGASKMGPTAAPAPDSLQAEVRVGAEYAIYLELGTVHMAARPFLLPAAEETTPMLDSLMKKNLKAQGLI